jgi:hypothetical protein
VKDLNVRFTGPGEFVDVKPFAGITASSKGVPIVYTTIVSERVLIRTTI